jgi:hypothetical protein
MPDLWFHVKGAEPASCSMAPALNFKLWIENRISDETVESILLRCQLQIEASRRAYHREEQQNLRDIFGEPADWGRTLRSVLWTQGQTIVPAFQGSVIMDLPIACTFDLTVASAKYFYGLAEGIVPLTFFFNGSVFYREGGGPLQVAPIPWSTEASFEMPVGVWKETVDRHYPNTGWLCLRRDVFDRLYQHKVAKGLPTWEQTLESLLS